MKKIVFLLPGLLISVLIFGQSDNQKLLELAKAYKNFMFRNDAAKDDIKEIKADLPGNLKTSADFIIQTITTKNKLLTEEFLSRPGDEVLKQIFMIRAVDINLREENPIDNNKLLDSLAVANIPVYELIDNYYSMLFTGVGNKNQPFDLSKTDLKLKDYHLKDDTEKGILVLRAVELCGRTIWGYMNVVKPANTKKAFENIEKFPKINGRPYYQYTDLYFQDFDMIIVEDKGSQSYKSYYIDKFYETLLSHLICLNKEEKPEKDINDLLLGSILKEKNLYKYTKYKETLEGIFKEQKTE